MTFSDSSKRLEKQLFLIPCTYQKTLIRKRFLIPTVCQVAAVTVAVTAYRRRKQRIKDINQLALVLGLLDEEDAVVSRENICSLCSVRRAAVTSPVQIIRCCWRPLAQYCLHGLRAASVWLCKPQTIEDQVLYHATVVSWCTR